MPLPLLPLLLPPFLLPFPLDSDYNNPSSQRLSVTQERGTNNYIISSARSAAQVRVVVRVRVVFQGMTSCGWSGCRRAPRYSRTEWLDVYSTAPGFDFGYVDRANADNTVARTQGLCGSYDSNRNNDQTNGNGLLVSSSRDFFRTRRAGSCTPYNPPVPDAKFCSVPPKPVQIPTLRRLDIEDLTELLRDISISDTDPRAAYTFDPDEVSSLLLGDDVIERYENLCESALRNSIAADVCEQVGVDLQQYIDNCVEDMITQEDEELILGAVDSMKDDCEFLASTDIDLFDADEEGNLVPGSLQRQVVERLCPGDCSFNGVCDNGTCICNAGWSGLDCSTNLTVVPTIRGLFPFSCDVSQGCPSVVTVSSDNLLSTADLSCRVGDQVSSGRFIATVQMECNMPRVNITGAQEEVVTVRIARDEGRFSTALPFVFFDGRCKQCTDDGECTVRDDACVIDNQCVAANQLAQDNPCLACVPQQSQTAFSPIFFDQQCGPQISGLDAYLTVSEAAPEGREVATFNVGNEFVTEAYTVAISNPEAQGVFDILPRGDGEYAVILLQQLDYETQPSTTFTVSATGQSSGDMHTATVSVDVLNVNEAPSMAEPQYTATVVENTETQVLFQAAASDPDAALAQTPTDERYAALTFSLAGFTFGSDAALFTVDPATGVVSTTGPLDYESRAEYTFEVVATDGASERAVAEVVVTVDNVNEKPTFIHISQLFVYENAEVGTVVGQLSTVDPDHGNTFTYELLNATDLFAVDGDKLVTAALFDFSGENKVVSMLVRSTDQGALSVEEVITVRVVNENDAPTTIELVLPTHNTDGTLSSTALTSLAEDTPTDTVVGVFKVADPDAGDLHIMTLVDDADGTFSVSGQALILTKPLDYETATSVSIVVQATDTGYPALTSPEQSFTIAVENRPDRPREIKLTLTTQVDEATPAGTEIGVVTAMDDDADQPMSMAASSGCPFTLGDVTCDNNDQGRTVCTAGVTLTRVLDLSDDAYLCEVTAITNDDALSGTAEIEVPVVNVNEAPTAVVLSANTVSEGVAPGALVGYLSAVDPDHAEVHTEGQQEQQQEEVFTFALPADAGDAATQARFEVREVTTANNNQQRFGLFVAGALDHEARPVETVMVTVTDSEGASATLPVEVVVEDLPMALVISDTTLPEVVDPASAMGQEVAHVSLQHFDRSDLSVSFSVTPAASPFEVVAAAAQAHVGRVLIRDPAGLDYETAPNHRVTFTVTATFSSSSSSSSSNRRRSSDVPDPVSATFEMVLTNVEEPPVFVNDEIEQPVRVAPGAESGSEIIVLSAFDPENSGQVQYSIVSGNDNGIFLLGSSSGRLVVLQSPEVTGAALNQEFELVIEATDGQQTTTFIVPIVLDTSLTTSTAAATTTAGGAGSTTAGDGSVTPGVNPTGPGVDLQESSGGDSFASSTLPVVIGVCAGVLLLVAVALFVFVRQRKTEAQPSFTFGSGTGMSSPMDNPLYHTQQNGFDDGFSAQMAGWYRADATRDECEAELINRGTVGEFIVRKYPTSPGWFMLHAKTGESEVTETKIRPQGASGQLVLVCDEIDPPRFGSLPELVRHYATHRSDSVGVMLKLSSGGATFASEYGYDEVQSLRPGLALEEDGAAPHLPLKAHQRDMITQMATGEEGDMYGNTTAARDLLQESSNI